MTLNLHENNTKITDAAFFNLKNLIYLELNLWGNKNDLTDKAFSHLENLKYFSLNLNRS